MKTEIASVKMTAGSLISGASSQDALHPSWISESVPLFVADGKRSVSWEFRIGVDSLRLSRNRRKKENREARRTAIVAHQRKVKKHV